MTSWRKRGKCADPKTRSWYQLEWATTSIQAFNNQVCIGSRAQLLLFDDWMIVLRLLGETCSNWLKEVEHDTLVTHLGREEGCWERERLISMILDSKKSPKLSTRCSRESCVGRVGNDFTLDVEQCYVYFIVDRLHPHIEVRVNTRKLFALIGYLSFNEAWRKSFLSSGIEQACKQRFTFEKNFLSSIWGWHNKNDVKRVML